MTDPLPIGEEIWVRRDLPARTKPFYYRETIVLFWLLLLAGEFVLPIFDALIRFTFLSNSADWRSWLHATSDSLAPNAALIAIPLLILTTPAWIFCIKRSTLCPIWLYAQQLTPDRLTVFRLLRPPKVIPLKGSTLTANDRFQSYKTVTISAGQGVNKIKLSFLTPEEHDRFMQYWNAANA